MSVANAYRNRVKPIINALWFVVCASIVTNTLHAEEPLPNSLEEQIPPLQEEQNLPELFEEQKVKIEHEEQKSEPNQEEQLTSSPESVEQEEKVPVEEENHKQPTSEPTTPKLVMHKSSSIRPYIIKSEGDLLVSREFLFEI